MMGVQGGPDGNLTHPAQGIHLERGTGRRREALDEQGGVFADEEPAVTDGRRPFRKVGNGGVQPLADFAHCGKALVHERSLRDARIIRQFGGESRQRNTHGQRVEHSEARGMRQKFATEKSACEGHVDSFFD